MTWKEIFEKYGIDSTRSFAEVMDDLYLSFTFAQVHVIIQDILEHADDLFNYAKIVQIKE